APIAFLLAIVAVLEARVTFPNSEVIQAADLVNYEASFKCANGCKLYVDRWDDDLLITQNGKVLASFTEISGPQPYAPKGLVLAKGTNYKVQANTTQPVANFVLYSVSAGAANYGLSVAAPQGTTGIKFEG
ncbi:hypothetical protein PMAYCL1PPCAC_00856, partial [Pristionchus mayeri]